MTTKKALPKLAISTLLAFFVLSIAIAQVGPGEAGPYIDQLWYELITTPDAQLTALLTHMVDQCSIPRPADLPTLRAAGFTITRTTRIGYTVLAENNLVYPISDVNMRRAINRMIDKDYIVGNIYAPLMDKCSFWLPPSVMYINPDAQLPTYTPGASPSEVGTGSAASYLNEGGFTMGSTPNPYYTGDPWEPWQAPYLRIDPNTGAVLAPIDFITRPSSEAPLEYETTLFIVENLRRAGLQVYISPKTWSEIVGILINSILDDYTLLNGVGMLFPSQSPGFLYNLLQSEQIPLWNIWNYADEAMDYWAEILRTTNDKEEFRQAVYKMQDIATRDEPFLPMLLWNMYTASTGPYYGEPGVIALVNQKGIGVMNDFWSPLFSRKEAPMMPTLTRIMGAPITTLNPLTANTESDWRILTPVMGGTIVLNPYSLNYWFFGHRESSYPSPIILNPNSDGTHSAWNVTAWRPVGNGFFNDWTGTYLDWDDWPTHDGDASYVSINNSSAIPLILRPDGDGDYTSWTGDYEMWQDTTPDGNATFVSATAHNLNETSTLQDHTTQTSAIKKVSLTIVAAQFNETESVSVPDRDDKLRMMLYINGEGYNGSIITPTTTYSAYTTDWTVNPATASAWTWTDIDALQAGVRSEQLGPDMAELRVTQIYVTVEPRQCESSTLRNPTAISRSITKVRVGMVARANVTADEQVQPMLVIGGEEYAGTSRDLTTSYQLYTDDWTMNPATDSPWTWSDITSLEAGVKSVQNGDEWTGEIRVTQLYTEVYVDDGDDYTFWNEWPTHEGDTTYVSATANNMKQTSTLNNTLPPSPAQWAIDRVTITIIARNTDPFSDERIAPMIIVDGKECYGPQSIPGGAYQEYTYEWSKNPAYPEISVSWNFSAVKDLEAGVRSVQNGATWQGELRVTQLYITITGKGTGPTQEPWVGPDGIQGTADDGMKTTVHLREDMVWQEATNTPVTAYDWWFCMEVLKAQNNAKYRSYWEPYYQTEIIDAYTFTEYATETFIDRFESLDIGFLAPKHIWEPFIQPTYEYTPPSSGIMPHITDWVNHHSAWQGWNWPSETSMGGSQLVGMGPFYYPIGAWQPTSCHIDANREWWGGKVCAGDVDLNGIVELTDLSLVLDAQGTYPGHPRWESPDSEHRVEMLGPAADIAAPAQQIIGAEISKIIIHFGHEWGPGEPAE